MYRQLNSEKIVLTTERLCQRVAARFPDSGLSRVSGELLQVAQRAAATSRWLARPNIPVRCGVIFCIGLLALAVLGTVLTLDLELAFRSIAEFVQAIESAINDLVFIAVAIFFLRGWETRRKRGRALKAIHELRSLAHVIDMHQLTKDPEMTTRTVPTTEFSPTRTLSAFELARYLDYCSEMLSIISKIAAVYVQRFDDHVTVSAVNDIEDLTTGLARKIWQKIMILDRLVSP